MTREEINIIRDNHLRWLDGKPYGKRANLSGADLSGADLSRADLRGAIFSCADLRYADLRYTILYRADFRGANLSGVNLYEADLREACLRNANLSYADFHGADLDEAIFYGADLRNANLRDTNLTYADIHGANLYGVDLSGANLRGAYFGGANLDGVTGIPPIVCPETGSFIGWKKCINSYIIKLEIPEDAMRSSATTRKCRASKAKVLEIQNLDGSISDIKEACSIFDNSFTYRVGEIIEPKFPFNTNRWNECASGIHFFMTREEAVNY